MRTTVLVPAYNAEAFLAEALASVLAQTEAPDQILVINDGSTDATGEVARDFDAPGLEVVDLPHNVGLAQAKNLGIDLALGQYLVICDADDIQMPHRVAKQVEVLASGYQLTGCAGMPFGDVAGSPIPNPVPMDGDHALSKARTLFQSPFADFGAAYETAFLRAHGLRFTSNGAWEDWDMYQQLIAAGGRVFADPRALVHYRRHAGQATSQNNAHRTQRNMRTALDGLGLAYDEDDLRLHHAIAPFPYGTWTDEDFVRDCGGELLAMSRAWLARVQQANLLSAWTHPEALARVCHEVLARVETHTESLSV